MHSTKMQRSWKPHAAGFECRSCFVPLRLCRRGRKVALAVTAACQKRRHVCGVQHSSSCSVPNIYCPRTCYQYCFFCSNNLFCNFKIDLDLRFGGFTLFFLAFLDFQWIYFNSRHQVMKILTPEQSDGSERLRNPPRFSEYGVWGHSDTLH